MFSCKKLLKQIRRLFNVFYIPLTFSSLRKKIKKLPSGTQLFFVARMDFGTHLFHLHYARCWREQRGKVALVILTPHIKAIKELATHLIPDALLIHPNPLLVTAACKLFKEGEFFHSSLVALFGMFNALYPEALYIYYPSYHSLYHPYFDKRLQQIPQKLSPAFLAAYKRIRTFWNLREETLYDLFHLHLNLPSPQIPFASSCLEKLRKEFHLNERFIILNLNAKSYQGLKDSENHRRLYHPERYQILIDYLIEKGYQVLLQGRKEQPFFKPRDGLIDYAHSSQCSAENDLALYAGAYFAIVNKTGPETFSSITNTPLLGLNYTEISCLIPHLKTRFFPKYVFDSKLGRNLTWREYLASPSFFDLNKHIFSADIEYTDLGEEEMVEAVDEFLPLVESEQWQTQTPLQQAFKAHLHPLHLDLYEMKTSLPCDGYLRRNDT